MKTSKAQSSPCLLMRQKNANNFSVWSPYHMTTYTESLIRINMGPLHGVKVLDLSRILAGPWATQILADFGACVWKIERPGVGDDTRRWGPPYLKDQDGNDTSESAYYLSANRGKYSIELDIALSSSIEKQHDRHILHRMIERADILVENFKVGTLAKYQLDYDSVQQIKPDIIYVSITGFGQTGPDADKAGYDAMIQGRGGLMSITGEPEGKAQKTGVAVADLMTGMYAVTGTLAALYHRDQMKTLTGKPQGQHIDVALLDTQVAFLANQNMNYLVGGRGTAAVPTRCGTAHPNIVPYQSFATIDGEFMLAVGNDQQFEQCVKRMGRPELAHDDRFRTNAQRVRHREALVAIMSSILATKSCQYWLDTFSSSSSSSSSSSALLEQEQQISIPCGPIQNIAQVFNDEQVKSRHMQFDLYHTALNVHVPMVANPIKFSKTPIEYSKPPPLLGQDTEAVTQSLMNYDECQE